MKRVVILGGGFGGIRCALDCARRVGDVADISIIDRAPAHVFTPTLYEVASAYRETEGPSSLKLRRSVSIPYSEIFAGTRVRHIQAEVFSVDPTTKTIHLREGKGVSYDYCVVSVGSQATDYGIVGATQYAYFFKTVDDALRVNARVYQLFRHYVQSSRERSIQILLVGAGFTGIELAAELACCLRKLGRTHGIYKKFFSIMIFEAADQMLPMINMRERNIIMKRLTEIGVGTSDHSAIESVHADHVKLADGHIWKGDMVIWTAGIKPSQLFSQIPELRLTDHGKVRVDKNLCVEGFDSLFAIGDPIEFIDPKTQQPVAALAYNAIDQGKIVAVNIVAAMKERSLHPYKPRTNMWVAPIGGKFAVVHVNPSIQVAGFMGWIIRWVIDLRYFLSILPSTKAFKLLKEDLIIFSQND